MAISMSPNVSALNAFSVGIQAAGYNIANISTNGFRPVAVQYKSGPGDQGVSPVVTRPKPGPVDSPSGTDLARETVNLMVNQRAFEANAVPIRTVDDMLGTLIDLKV